MKRIFTLVTCFCLCITAESQVLLNELYPLPNAGKNEFFELYNNSITVFPISLSDYTILTYFEIGSEKGFYVLDLPDLYIEPKGYFVGSSALPFSYQGFVNSTKSDFSWNDAAFLSAHNGYLKKWVLGTSVPAATDGNANYDEKPVPANLNDLFVKKSGGGASYNMFIYKSGVLVNAFFGGINNTTVPSFITDMPVLNVQIAGGPTFTIDFPHYSNIRPVSEFVNAEVGTDNGFIRTQDGYCGAWTKSSSTAFHTPGETNGGRTGIDGSVSFFGTIERGVTAADSSTITYKVNAAPIEALPLTLDLYVDLGGKPGEVDTTDMYLTSQTITGIPFIEYKTKFLPANASVIIAIKTAAGCLDRVVLVTNMVILHYDPISFTGAVGNNKAGFQWKITQDQNVKLFEVQESIDGVQFSTIGFTPATAKQGLEQYALNTSTQVVQTRFYRLKTVYIDQSVSYSKIIKLGGEEMNQGIVLKKNPAASNLEFTYTSSTANIAEISIYSMTGARLYSTHTMTQKGFRAVSINLNGRIAPGTYVLEVKSGAERYAVKFLKN